MGLGGFDLALGAGTPCRGGEDLVMFARLAWRGYSVGFEPAALVHHTHRRGRTELRRQIEGYGVGWGALLLASILEDPRHLGRMLGTVPRGARALSSSYRRKLRSRHADGKPPAATSGATAIAAQATARTSELAKLELRGIAAGPSAYLRSRRRWSG